MYSLNPLFSSRVSGEPFTQEQLNQIKDYLKKGFNKKEVVELTGISRGALNLRIKNDNWVAGANAGKRTHKLTSEELVEIKEKYDNGTTVPELALEYSISESSLYKRIANNKWGKTSRKTKYFCNETYFDVIDTEHKAYWLGFLYADGYILSKRSPGEQQSFGFSISTTDIELCEKFKADLKSNHPVNIYNGSSSFFKEGGTYARILITSQHMVDMLKQHGLTENKTYTITWPQLRADLIPHFIRGYSDGDGSIVIAHLTTGRSAGTIKYSWSITSTKEMCQGILNFLGKPNLKLYQRFPERQVNNWTMEVSGNQQVPKLFSKIYDNATIFLERKYKKYAEMQGILKV